VIVLSLITFLSTFAPPETRGRDLTDPADAR
jgi:MFS transporter, MHS family, metabolite:H+ symporter